MVSTLSSKQGSRAEATLAGKQAGSMPTQVHCLTGAVRVQKVHCGLPGEDSVASIPAEMALVQTLQKWGSCSREETVGAKV